MVTTICRDCADAYGRRRARPEEPQVINIPLSRPGEPIYLEIGILSARIEVIGEDRDDVEFTISVSDGSRQIITPSGAKQLKGGGYAFEIDEEDNEISFDMDWRANTVSVIARVPRRADLDLGTTNDGEIIVSNITGNLELSNTNGPITATGIRGSVIAESVNDDIKISFAEVVEGEAMRWIRSVAICFWACHRTQACSYTSTHHRVRSIRISKSKCSQRNQLSSARAVVVGLRSVSRALLSRTSTVVERLSASGH